MSTLPVPGDHDRKLTARGRERRQELVDFAAAQFAQKGYHPTSVAEIVDGVGVGKGVFYWYFRGKEDLMLEILEQALHDLRRHQAHAIDGEASPINRLELGIRASMAWSVEHADLMRLVLFAWTEEPFARSLRKGRRISIADTAQHVQAAMDQGLAKPGDATLVATAIRGVIDELSRSTTLGSATFEGDPVDHAVRMCLHGLIG